MGDNSVERSKIFVYAIIELRFNNIKICLNFLVKPKK